MLLVGLVALTGCKEYVPRLALADCTSERFDSAGVLTVTTYDGFGWPIVEEVSVNGGEPEVTTTEYTRVAGRVVEALSLTDPIAHIYQYDGHEHLRYTDSNLEGDDGYECTNFHDGDIRTTSSCTNGVETVYDACDNPVEITSPEGRVTFGYSYEDCRILNIQSLGADAGGPFAENTQYFAGRPVSRVREQDGGFFASMTSWDCPAAE
ncbi:MAG: hypothetical protein KC656_21450 [Myxococcales bacterium]|nr:hypothetical protein [Myxococcales bacterium]